MANQRAKHKRNVTVTMEDDLRIAIERYARKNGLDRTAAVKFMCRSVLKLPEKKYPPQRRRGRSVVKKTKAKAKSRARR